MAYDILKGLESGGRLGSCSIALKGEGIAGGRAFVFGRDIVSVDRQKVTFRGGETGQEALTLPLEEIQEIESGGRTVFRKGRRIERVYPKKRH